jgi:MOSC domain-containing protein
VPEFIITHLFKYPVKSMQSLAFDAIEVDTFGFQHDRRFMLVDASGQFITQRKHPKLALYSASYDGASLTIAGPNDLVLHFGLHEFVACHDVSVWSDTVKALQVKDKRTEVLSKLLGVDLSLVYMPESTFRRVDPDFCVPERRVSFADGFPFLLCNQASLGDLNAKLDLPVGMNRFRPNIVFEGDAAFQEDQWRRIAIGALEFDLVKPCSRCILTCTDEEGRRHKEPLKTLASYRRNEYGVCFGQNMVHRGQGLLAVGDVLRVLE